MIAAATEADILDGLVRHTKASGLYRNADQSRLGWHVSTFGDGLVRIWLQVEGQHVTRDRSWTVTAALALAWILTVETDPEPVDVGRCPACVERGGSMEWRVIRWNPHADFPGMTWDWAIREIQFPHATPRLHCSRPCPACSGTGRETVPLARLLLDAAQPCSPCGDTGMVGEPPFKTACQICTPRQRLRVHVEQLVGAGHPLGEVVGFALGPWAGEPTETIQRVVTGPTNRDVRDNIEAACDGLLGWRLEVHPPRSQGYNICAPEWAAVATYGQPGHPGTAESLRWLEWLTWAREFEAERHRHDQPETDQPLRTWGPGEAERAFRQGIEEAVAHFDSARRTGRTQRMLEQAAAHPGRALVVAGDPNHARDLQRRADDMGATNIEVVVLGSDRWRERPMGEVFYDHDTMERARSVIREQARCRGAHL
jgi:hypothetical protein